MLLFTVSLFAMGQDPTGIDLSNPGDLVASVTTLVVLGLTYLVRKIKPSISGSVTLIIVFALSAVIPYITELLSDTSLGYWPQFGLGLLSVVLHQLKTQFSGGDD